MSSILHTNFPAPILFRIVARKTAKLALFFWAVGGLLAVHANSKEFSDDVPQTDEIVVTGKVTDENGEGLPGATVTVKNTSLGTITDVDGNFSLEVPEDAILVFSFVGYVSQEVVLKGQSVINTSLSPDLTSLDEVVVIGYGETKTRDLTGAVSIVDPDDLGQQPVSNIGDAIQGRAAGVSVTTSGQPGSNPTFRIRGIGTINSNDPFIVVDGMPLNGGLNQINMNDIESVQVLKDASATAIYGARGANGVVLITTKRGKKGKHR